ncbi:hypothetical protein [Neobacillus sp. NPDC093127]|uniref:hypothetical protein n=1 Tax=Neobacillus sp. NPDC093127 TaxID=3364296 RepID=UPI00382F513C
MEENYNKEKQKPNGEIDPFSSFLFGNSKQRETYKESENNSQEQKEYSSFLSRSNRIDDWFFGSRGKEQNSDPTTQNQIENLLNNVDFELLMETIDMLVDTSNQFKPLIKEITPFFNQFIKKFKTK